MDKSNLLKMRDRSELAPKGTRFTRKEDRTIKKRYVYLLAILIGCFIGYAVWHDEQVVIKHSPKTEISVKEVKVPVINLTSEQAELLKIAYEEGSKYGRSEYVQGILCTETRSEEYGKTKYGIVSLHDKNKKIGKQSYGPCQIQLNTAKCILKEHPELGKFRTDDHLLAALITDPRFNISLAAAHFSDLAKIYGERRALLAYNRGTGAMRDGKDPMGYIRNTQRYIKTIVKPFNQGLYSTDKGPSSLD